MKKLKKITLFDDVTSAKTERIAIRVTPEFYERLKVIAKSDRRKVGDLVRIILEDEVERIEQPPRVVSTPPKKKTRKAG